MLQGVGSLQNRCPVLHILLQGQQVDGQERHVGLRNEKTHHPEPQHCGVNQRRHVLQCRVWGRRARVSAWLPATGKSPILDRDSVVTGCQETAWREAGGGWKGPVVSPARSWAGEQGTGHVWCVSLPGLSPPAHPAGPGQKHQLPMEEVLQGLSIILCFDLDT